MISGVAIQGEGFRIEDSVLDVIWGHARSRVGGSYRDVSIAAQTKAFEGFPRFAVPEGC